MLPNVRAGSWKVGSKKDQKSHPKGNRKLHTLHDRTYKIRATEFDTKYNCFCVIGPFSDFVVGKKLFEFINSKSELWWHFVEVGEALLAGKPRPAPESRSLSVAWPPFAKNLAAVLEKLEEDQFLILSVKRSNQCVQFAAQGAFGMRVETTSNSYLAELDQLNSQQVAALINAGWHEPTGTPESSTPQLDPDGSPNFFKEFSPPVSFGIVANLAVHTLAEILRVPHPGLLEYKAFDAGGRLITLPELGLQRATKPAS
jgi:hypothetical protein